MERTKRHALSVVLDMIIYIQIQEKKTYYEEEKVKKKKKKRKKERKKGKSKGVGKNAEEPSIHPYWPIPALYRSRPAESLTWLCPKRRLKKADSDCTIANILLKTEAQMLFQSRMGPSLRRPASLPLATRVWSRSSTGVVGWCIAGSGRARRSKPRKTKLSRT